MTVIVHVCKCSLTLRHAQHYKACPYGIRIGQQDITDNGTCLCLGHFYWLCARDMRGISEEEEFGLL